MTIEVQQRYPRPADIRNDLYGHVYTDWQWVGNVRNAGPSVPSFAALNGTVIYCYQFANGNEVHCDDLQLPHDYAEGTDLITHIHFCATTATRITGTWTLDVHGWVDNSSTLGAVQTTTYGFDVNPPTAFAMITASFSSVLSGTSRKISSIIQARLSLALTSGANLALLGLDAHYQKDSMGSIQIVAKP